MRWRKVKESRGWRGSTIARWPLLLAATATAVILAMLTQMRPRSAYRLYPGRDHVSLVAGHAALDADLIAWTRERFAGVPDTPYCSVNRSACDRGRQHQFQF